jgi:hypothetical protein
VKKYMGRLLRGQDGGIQNYMATGVLILAVLATAVAILAASGRLSNDFDAKVDRYLNIK